MKALRIAATGMLADEPQAFAQAVLHLLNHPQRAAQMGAAGRQWALAHYDWHTVYKKWDAIYAVPNPAAEDQEKIHNQIGE